MPLASSDRLSHAAEMTALRNDGRVFFDNGTIAMVAVRPHRICPEKMAWFTKMTLGLAAPVWLVLHLVDRMSARVIALTVDESTGEITRRSLRIDNNWKHVSDAI